MSETVAAVPAPPDGQLDQRPARQQDHTPDRLLDLASPGVRDCIRLTHRLSACQDRPDAAGAIAEDAVRELGCGWAGVARRNKTAAIVFDGVLKTQQVAYRISRIARSTGEGVGCTVLAERTTLRCDDLRTDERWPRYAARVLAETPVRSALGLPLQLAGDDLGALILYDAKPGFFTDDVLERAETYVQLVSVALASAEHRATTANLRIALDSARIIGQSIGILMARYTLTSDRAFTLLCQFSQHAHRKLREIAADVVEQGDLPA